MRKTMYVAIGLLFISLLGMSQMVNRDDVSVTVTETKDTYKIEAKYDKVKTKKVLTAIDKQFKNTEVDAVMTLDKRITFYIKSFPGKLKVSFNKEENTPEAYDEIKKIAERIKEAVK